MAKQVMTQKDFDAAIKAGIPEGNTLRKIHTGGSLYLWLARDGADGKVSMRWRYRYQIGGHEKLVALGVYPEVSLKEARAARDKLDSTDPAAARAAVKKQASADAANSFKSVALAWYAKRSAPWSESHKNDVLSRRLEQHLFPYIGSKPIASIEASDIITALEKLEDRGAVDAAHRTLQTVQAVFRFAIGKKYVKHNIASDCKDALATPVPGEQPAVHPDELPALLRAIDSYHTIGTLQVRLALQLLLLTGTRTSELINATWDEIDTEAALWTIPASRMKMNREHLIPLSRQALDVLAELKMIAGDNEYVLPGRSWEKPLSDSAMLGALYRLGFKGKQSSHGFRSLFSTIANEEWKNPGGADVGDVVEIAIAHLVGSKTRRSYNRAKYLADRKRLFAWWADRLDIARSSGKVVVLRATA